MRKITFLLVVGCLILGVVGFASAGWVQDQYGQMHWVDNVQPNTYGHGINSDTYGRPHVYRNQFGQSDPNWNVKRNGYGYGVHMNQYGQPVFDSQPGSGRLNW